MKENVGLKENVYGFYSEYLNYKGPVLHLFSGTTMIFKITVKFT